jgi:hypothetical protein
MQERHPFSPQHHVLRSGSPLREKQMRNAAPSISRPEEHVGRSDRCAYIASSKVLRG